LSQGGADLAGKIVGQEGVGVEKEEDLSLGKRRPGIHLPGPSWGGLKHLGPQLAGDGHRLVRAVAVDHDDL